MVTTINAVNTTSPTCRLGDNATLGAGTYEILCEANQPSIEMIFPSIIDVQISTISMSTSFSMIDSYKLSFILKHDGSSTKFDNLKKAIVYWNKNKSLVYVTYSPKFSTPADILKIPDFSTQTLSTFTARVAQFTAQSTSIDEMKINMQLVYKNL